MQFCETLATTPAVRQCSSSQDSAGKRGEREAGPNAEVSDLLCGGCRKASKAAREGRWNRGHSACSDKEGTGKGHQNQEKLSDSCSPWASWLQELVPKNSLA